MPSQYQGLVKATLCRHQPTHVDKSRLAQKGCEFLAQQCSVNGDEVPAVPSYARLFGDVQMHCVLAIARPIPELVVDSPILAILKERRWRHGWMIYDDLVVIANACHK